MYFLILELPDRPRNVTRAKRDLQASFYGVGRLLTPFHHDVRGKNIWKTIDFRAKTHNIPFINYNVKPVLDSAEPQRGICFRMVLWDPEELEDDRPHKMKSWDSS